MTAKIPTRDVKSIRMMNLILRIFASTSLPRMDCRENQAKMKKDIPMDNPTGISARTAVFRRKV